MSSSLPARRATAASALGRSSREHDRLRVQSRTLEAATSRLLARVGLEYDLRSIGALPTLASVEGLESLAEADWMFAAAYTSVLPTAIAHGITIEPRVAATLSEDARDAEALPRPSGGVAAADRGLEAPAAAA